MKFYSEDTFPLAGEGSQRCKTTTLCYSWSQFSWNCFQQGCGFTVRKSSSNEWKSFSFSQSSFATPWWWCRVNSAQHWFQRAVDFSAILISAHDRFQRTVDSSAILISALGKLNRIFFNSVTIHECFTSNCKKESQRQYPSTVPLEFFCSYDNEHSYDFSSFFELIKIVSECVLDTQLRPWNGRKWVRRHSTTLYVWH